MGSVWVVEQLRRRCAGECGRKGAEVPLEGGQWRQLINSEARLRVGTAVCISSPVLIFASPGKGMSSGDPWLSTGRRGFIHPSCKHSWGHLHVPVWF